MKGFVAKRVLSLVLAFALVWGVAAEGCSVQAKQEQEVAATAADKQQERVVGNSAQSSIQYGNWVYYSYAEMGKKARVFAYNVKTGKKKVVLKANYIGAQFMQLRYYDGFLYACLADGELGYFALYRTNLKTGKQKKLDDGSDALIYNNRILYNYYNADGSIVTKSMKLNGKNKKVVFDGVVTDLKGKYFYGYNIGEDQYYKFTVDGKNKKAISFDAYWEVYMNQKYYTSPTVYYQNVYFERGDGFWGVKVGKNYYYVDPENPFGLVRENIKTGKKILIHETPGLQFSFVPVGKYFYVTEETGGTPNIYLIKQNGTLVKQLY